jgi:hypothetical protein
LSPKSGDLLDLDALPLVIAARRCFAADARDSPSVLRNKRERIAKNIVVLDSRIETPAQVTGVVHLRERLARPASSRRAEDWRR